MVLSTNMTDGSSSKLVRTVLLRYAYSIVCLDRYSGTDQAEVVGSTRPSTAGGLSTKIQKWPKRRT